MAPMTRSRAIGNIPNQLMANYYRQRATAGLIITEGTSPSPNGLGYARIPGIYSPEQVEGWKKVTSAVHDKGGHIFVQLMHTGRVTHPLNLPEGARVVGPSAVAAQGAMWTDQQGMQPQPVPHALTTQEVEQIIEEHVEAAKNAIKAGFDGVELHGANGYLIEQFLHPVSNQRTDAYGGSIENRSRFALEVARQVAAAIGKDRVGIRLSPYGVYNDMPPYQETEATYAYLAEKLNELGIVYIHLVDHSSQGAPAVLPSVVQKVRDAFSNTLILSGGYDQERAEKDLQSKLADLVAFGRPFISNPDLVERFRAGAQLVMPDSNYFYTPEPKGYTDYPTLETQAA
jgi:N-ethylmaleimide reductase